MQAELGFLRYFHREVGPTERMILEVTGIIDHLERSRKRMPLDNYKQEKTKV